jgi:hypothetical protein
MFMGLDWKKWTKNDFIFGIILPIVAVFVIVLISKLPSIVGGGFGIVTGLTMEIGELVVIVGVPLALGLLWNKWAGGAAGFIMGSIYYVASAGQYNGVYASAGVTTYNFFGDISMLFWIVYGVIIGYMAGALTNGSTNFKRMLGAGLTSSIIVAVIQAYLNYTISLEPARNMAQQSWVADPVLAFVVAFVPGIALGVIVPILAKVMTWYGLQPMRH